MTTLTNSEGKLLTYTNEFIENNSITVKLK